MYELKQGSARIVHALHRITEDPARVEAIARATNYLPEQLKEDIQALYDYYTAATAEGIEV